MRTLRLALPLLLAAPLLAGCAPDLYAGPGYWRPSGANDANLRAMAARPQELARGTHDPQGTDANTTTSAITRLRSDRTTPLPDSNISRIGGGN